MAPASPSAETPMPVPIRTTPMRNQMTAAAAEAVAKDVGGTRRAVLNPGTMTPQAPAR
jgi:hypothetical protein